MSLSTNSIICVSFDEFFLLIMGFSLLLCIPNNFYCMSDTASVNLVSAGIFVFLGGVLSFILMNI